MNKILSTHECENIIKNIRTELSSYIKTYRVKSLIIGESGGIDSALCSALASPVCDRLGIPLIGRSITIQTNKQDEIDRGEAIGKAFCHNFSAIDFGQEFSTLKPSFEFDATTEGSLVDKLRQGNIKARMRMLYLYDLAQKHQGMVLSTDNYTEYLLGFWTLHGDVGDYGMIQNLWKTEVYTLAQHIADHELLDDASREALRACISATPCDGLGISNSDLDQLQASSYSEVDNLLYCYINQQPVDENHPVIKRHKASHYKRENPYNLSRESILQ